MCLEERREDGRASNVPAKSKTSVVTSSRFSVRVTSSIAVTSKNEEMPLCMRRGFGVY